MNTPSFLKRKDIREQVKAGMTWEGKTGTCQMVSASSVELNVRFVTC